MSIYSQANGIQHLQKEWQQLFEKCVWSNDPKDKAKLDDIHRRIESLVHACYKQTGIYWWVSYI